MNFLWLTIFQLEILLAGIFLCGKAFIKISIGVDYTIHLGIGKISKHLMAEGLFLLLVGLVILSIPKVKSFLRNNKISSYLIPMHIWILLVLIGIELTLRVAVFNQPFGSVYTNWFGGEPPKNSFYIWGREGFSITHYDGPPGEIHTPFQGGENIILLGDSFLQGLQVSDDQKFASVAETILHQNGYNFDLHNFGHSGMAMADYVSGIIGYKELYHPKAIVIQLSDTDFIESFSTSKTNYFIAKNSTIMDIFQKNKIVGDYKTADVISDNFRLMLWDNYGKSKFNQIFTTPATGAIISSPPEEFDVNLAKQQMDLLLKVCNGTKLILLLYPHAPYISGDHINMEDPKHENLKAFLMEYYPQVTLVDPLPELQDLTSSGHLPMGFFNSTTPGWGHFNRWGNEVLGEQLAKTIAEVVN